MKYFLASLLITCMSSVAVAQSSYGGWTIGTLEMWSPWIPGDQEVNMAEVCLDVSKSYNEINEGRGYWGQLVDPMPVRMILKQGLADAGKRKFFCLIRVFKGVVPESTSN